MRSTARNCLRSRRFVNATQVSAASEILRRLLSSPYSYGRTRHLLLPYDHGLIFPGTVILCAVVPTSLKSPLRTVSSPWRNPSNFGVGSEVRARAGRSDSGELVRLRAQHSGPAGHRERAACR